MTTLEWYQELLNILIQIPGYVGVLEYGSRARGSATPASDIDTIVVVEKPLQITRLHSSTLDLNFLPLDDLISLIHRIEKNSQFPWDTMLGDTRVIADPSGRIQSIIGKLNSAFTKGDRFDSTEINGFRFLIARLVSEGERPNADEVHGYLITYRVITALLVCYNGIQGRWWQGIKRALSYLRNENPTLYNLAIRSIKETDFRNRIEILKEMSDLIFAPFGGSWKGEPLVIESWLHVEISSNEQSIPSNIWERLISHLK